MRCVKRRKYLLVEVLRVTIGLPSLYTRERPVGIGDRTACKPFEGFRDHTACLSSFGDVGAGRLRGLGAIGELHEVGPPTGPCVLV